MPRQNTFKLRGTHLFLTYPQAAGIELEQLYDHLKSLDYGRELLQILVAKEQHQDGEPHYHVYLKFNDRFETRNVRFFDFNGKHPNAQNCRSPKGVIEYCTKDGNYKAEKKVGNAWKAWDIKVKITWADVHAAKNSSEFWETVIKADPRAAIINNSPIKRYADKKFTERPVYVPQFERHQFNEMEGMTEWVNVYLRFVSFT